MIDYDELKVNLLNLKERLNKIGGSLWHTKNSQRIKWIRRINITTRFLEW